MGLLDALKKKDPKLAGVAPAPPPPPWQGTPVQAVLQLEQQGKTDPEIVQELTKQGFNQTQIYDAIVQARAQGGPEPFMPPAPAMQQTQSFAPAQNNAGEEHTREVVEQLVEEKYELIKKEMDKWQEWKEKFESRVDQADTHVQDLRADLENLHKAIVGKIGEYDRNLMDVGVEMKAMEQVFKKVLPELTTNVQELSRINKQVKSKSEKEKSAK